MRTVFLTFAAAVAFSASPALAAAEGPYVGVAVTHDNIAGTGDAEGLGLNGVGGSVFAGFNYDLSAVAFVGLEANFDLASADRDIFGTEIKADHAYGVSGRLGYRVSPGAALYGRVGYQRGRVSVDTGAGDVRESADGLRLGGGVEANVAGNVAVRVEYNHTHYYVEDSFGPDAGLANNQAVVGVVVGF
jgi:outer membrane immunogenic protein